MPDCFARAYFNLLCSWGGVRRGVHSARLRREAPTHCGHCGGSLTRHLRCLRHTLAFHRIGSCSLRRRSYAGCVYTPPALPVRGFSLPCCFCFPRRTALPSDSAFPACDGRNDSSILLVRPSERAFVQEKPCYPSAAASADSFPLRFRFSGVRRTERWLDSAPMSASEGGSGGSLLLRGLSTPGQGEGTEKG